MPLSVTGNVDVVIISGAVIGSAAAYFLSENQDFDGSIVVIEPDPAYENAQSTRSGNSIREQFSNPVNIRISQFGMEFIRDFHDNVAVDGESPLINFHGTGYLFLSEDQDHFAGLARDHAVQVAEGADVRLLRREEVGVEFPYLNTETLVGARIGSVREGSFDSWALLQGMRRRAEHNGVRYLRDTVVELDTVHGRVTSVVVASGQRIDCGHVVNAAGTRAADALLSSPTHLLPQKSCGVHRKRGLDTEFGWGGGLETRFGWGGGRNRSTRAIVESA